MTDFTDVDFADEAPEPRRIRFDPTRGARENVFREASRHSQRVRWLKFLLPALAIAAVVAFFVTMRFAVSEGEVAVSLAGVNIEEKSLVMKSPHISGFQRTKQSYEVTAVRALQDLNNSKVVRLEQITAKLGMGGGTTATITSKAGIYDGNAETLQLSGGIDAKTSDGYNAKLDKAAIDVNAGGLTSSSPVEINGAEGVIKANGIEVFERGKRIKFVNGVSVTYIPQEDSEAPPATAKTEAEALKGTTPVTTDKGGNS